MTHLSPVLDPSERTLGERNINEPPLRVRRSLCQNFMSHLAILTTYIEHSDWEGPVSVAITERKTIHNDFFNVSSPHKQWIMLTTTLARSHFISFFFLQLFFLIFFFNFFQFSLIFTTFFKKNSQSFKFLNVF